jgi:hypothetical protein
VEVSTAWVKPPPQVGGLDHLAVQAPCINIYGRLLPGITNVTDRARYYSFYPWLICAFDQRGFTTYNDEFIERFRRADCLFTLIAERHAALSMGDHEDHAGAMVGSNTLAAVARDLADGASIKLSDYSLRQGAKARYFKNKLGGLGQYYLGVLRELSILDGDTANGVKYTRQVGQAMAEHLEAGFDSGLFLAAVEADSVSRTELDALSSLCPCRLAENAGEQEILTSLFFVRDTFYDVEALPRRRTLQTILQLSSLLRDQNHELSELTFRACAYSDSLPDGTRWPTPETLVGNRAKWTAYARNEYLSIATQGLFFAVLDGYQEAGLRFDSSAQIADWFLEQKEVGNALAEIGADQTFTSSVAGAKSWLPDLSEWTNSIHEVQLVERIAQLSRQPKSAENRRDIISASLRTLIALAQRSETEDKVYGDLVFDEGYFRSYPINLQSFGFHRTNTWSVLTMREALRWLLVHWGMEVHLRVALRKLRGQSQSTFRIRPSDRGLEVIDVPRAVHTRPRFNQAIRILKDIGALERDDSGQWHPSDLGRSIVELGDAA